MEPFPRAFTFDDVLIEPQASSVEPHKANVETEVARGLFLRLPFLSAAMDRVTEADMAIALGKLGALGVIHRNSTLESEVAEVRKAKKAKVLVAAACGPFDIARAQALEVAGADAIVLDCAHGHNLNVIKGARAMKKKLKKAKLIVGNIATAQAALALVSFADAIKVGIGPGSICTTRIISGVGVPQFSAILAVSRVAKKYKVPVIADGGIKTSGDIAKALAAGASAVMMGNMFSGTLESPGKIIEKNGKKYKVYRGMGSSAVIKEKHSSDRYFSKGENTVAEGVEAHVLYKGPVAPIVERLTKALGITMGYVGAKDIPMLHKRAKFIFVTKASVRESFPHGLDFIIG
ncbi:MAG: IMP dehydrogenase [Patescibacteria group bacterium]